MSLAKEKMKVGDLVRWRLDFTRSARGRYRKKATGIVIRVDDNHRQTSLDVLFAEGVVSRIWKNHLEVIDE